MNSKVERKGPLYKSDVVNNLVRDATKVPSSECVYDALAGIGSRTFLGSKQGTGTVTLSESIKHFRYLYIRVGFYSSGYASYGQMLMPVDCISINSDSTYDNIIVCSEGSTVGGVKFGFTDETTFRVDAIYDTGRYCNVSGIK